MIMIMIMMIDHHDDDDHDDDDFAQTNRIFLKEIRMMTMILLNKKEFLNVSADVFATSVSLLNHGEYPQWPCPTTVPDNIR
jgi:hypothetical protein